ncbi:hypothetical protein Mapa_005043 [Marchantia paleacea]|nr:hypothetical protein Mapa_005043 [Marchantia paleacea]
MNDCIPNGDGDLRYCTWSSSAILLDCQSVFNQICQILQLPAHRGSHESASGELNGVYFESVTPLYKNNQEKKTTSTEN